ELHGPRLCALGRTLRTALSMDDASSAGRNYPGGIDPASTRCTIQLFAKYKMQFGTSVPFLHAVQLTCRFSDGREVEGIAAARRQTLTETENQASRLSTLIAGAGGGGVGGSGGNNVNGDLLLSLLQRAMS